MAAHRASRARMPRLLLRPLLGLLAAAAPLWLTGCAFSNIDLVQDHRVHIVTPRTDAVVRLPVTISWRTSGLPALLGGAPVRFAVFVDRRVIKPGADLWSVADGDRQCLRSRGCPNADYLHQHGVYVVSGTSLTLPFLPDLRNSSAGIRTDRHTVTVVILRGDHRDGESAFIRSFTIARTGAQ